MPLVRFFTECQEQAVLRAVSEANIALEEFKTLQGVLQAARNKIDRRHQADFENRKVMAGRIDDLADLALEFMKKIGREVTREVPGVKGPPPERSKPENEYYWRKQIIELARARSYFADLREPRCWARLQLQDGGITDFIVVLHFVGNPSPGSCIAGAFLFLRDIDGHDTQEAETVFLPSNPLFLTVEEDESAQQSRFRKWLDEVILIGLAEWKKRL